MEQFSSNHGKVRELLDQLATKRRPR